MKLAIFAFIAGLCLVAVTGNATGDFAKPVEEFDIELLTNEVSNELVETDTQAFLYFVLKRALRTLKGLNCAIQGAVNMKNASQQFIDDVQSCGVEATKQVLAVINSCKAIISTTNDILNVNENICNNKPGSEINGSKKTGWSCFWKLLKKFITLKRQIAKSLKLIKAVPTIGTGANACVTTATTDLTSVFTGFPAFVKNCSKLTS